MKEASRLSNKGRLRQEFKETLSSLSPNRRKKASSDLFKQFSTEDESLITFASFRFEIDLWPLNAHLAKRKKLILPKVNDDQLVFYRVESLDSQLVENRWGIFEPISEKTEKIDPRDYEAILVPALCFDDRFHRLGYGKGFYDRALSTLQGVKKIGVGFKEQMSLESIDSDHFDVPLDELCLF